MRKVYSSSEKDLAQQPIEKDGYSSDKFNKLYGKDKNPYLGSDRDRSKRKWRLNSLLNRQDKEFDGEPWNWKKLKNNGNNKKSTEGAEKSELGK